MKCTLGGFACEVATKAEAVCGPLYVTSPVMQEPLLFSRCVYKNLKMRMSDRSRMQTLHILEAAADRHRIGSCIYIHVADKLKGNTYDVHALEGNSKHNQVASAAPHMKLLERITEHDVMQRLRLWAEQVSEQ